MNSWDQIRIGDAMKRRRRNEIIYRKRKGDRFDGGKKRGLDEACASACARASRALFGSARFGFETKKGRPRVEDGLRLSICQDFKKP